MAHVSRRHRHGLVVLLVLFFGFPALAQIFHEDFDGAALDPTRWHLEVGDGSCVMEDGRLTLSCPGGDFPYVTPIGNPFPAEDDILIRVGFRYPHVLSGGNGFGAQFTMHGFGVWQDSQGFLRLAVGDLYPVTVSAAIDNAPHVFEWRYVAGVWSAWLDGAFVASDPSDFRPTTLFIGHPPEPHPYWTTQEIDFLHIEALGSVPSQASTWGEVKGLFR